MAMLVIAAVIVPGAFTGDEGATVEAVASEESGATTAAETEIGENTEDTVANCRYGAATKSSSSQYQWLDDMGAGWWLDFQVNYSDDKAPANQAEYAHVIWVEQKKNASGDYLNDYDVVPTMENDSLGHLIQNRPGRMWIVGNEVDRGPNPPPGNEPGQGDTMPQMYARIYHDVYHYIKQWDPTALVTPSALVEFTPGRAQYLDIVWNTYKTVYGKSMPVDFWNMHLYILPEVTPDGSPNNIANVALGTNPALGIHMSGGDPAKCALNDVYCMAEHDDPDVFAEQVVRMRQWMKDHGYRNYPLIITEYSLLYKYELTANGCEWKDEFGNCFTPQRVRNYAADTFNYLNTATDPNLGYPYDNNRLVQQWMWYSMHQTTHFATSNLATDGSGTLDLTLAGQAFSNATRAEPASVNLIATEPRMAPASADDGTVTARLSVTMRNNGNTRVDQPIKVTFYRDAALTQVIGSKTVPAPDADFVGMTGCSVRGITVGLNATWNEDLAGGEHSYWVKVDSDGLIAEGNEGDNVAVGKLLVAPGGVFIPLLKG
jgi:hypothetical protein